MLFWPLACPKPQHELERWPSNYMIFAPPPSLERHWANSSPITSTFGLGKLVVGHKIPLCHLKLAAKPTSGSSTLNCLASL